MAAERISLDELMIKDFLALGCTNRKDASVAYQIYADLCEGAGNITSHFSRCTQPGVLINFYDFLAVKRLYDVKYFYQAEIEHICLTGKTNNDEKASIELYIPLPVSSTIEHSYIIKILETFQTDYEYIVLGIVDSDSTCVYYRLRDGLVHPNNEPCPRNERRKITQYHDGVLLRNKENIKTAALYQQNIRLDTNPCGSSSTSQNLNTVESDSYSD